MSIEEPVITLNPKVELPSWQPAEKTILSILIQEPVLMADAPLLTDEHFHDAGRRTVFSAIQRICDSSSPSANLLNDLRHHLHQRGEFDVVGGDAGLTGLYTYETLATSAKLAKAVQILNQQLARRKAIKAGMNLIEEAFGCGEEIERVLDAASSPVTAIFEAVAESKPPTSTRTLIEDAAQRYLDRANGVASPNGYGTGIFPIDQELYGLLFPGRVVTVGGYPSGGKSVFGSQVLTHTAANGIPSLYIPLEMSEMDLIDRAIIQASGAEAEAWTDPKGFAAKKEKTGPTVEERNKFRRGVEKLLSAKFHIVKPSNKRLQTVLSVIRKSVREMGAKVVAVDFVQQIRVPEAKGNREQTMEEISHSFQEIAEELQIALLVLSQLNADGDTKHGKVVEEDADAFLTITQDMNKSSLTFRQHQDILIVKDRHYGKSGTRLPVILDRERIKFVHGLPVKPGQSKVTANF